MSGPPLPTLLLLASVLVAGMPALAVPVAGAVPASLSDTPPVAGASPAGTAPPAGTAARVDSVTRVDPVAQVGITARVGIAARVDSASRGDSAVRSHPVAGMDPVAPAGRFGWPVPGRPEVLRRFRAPAMPYGPGHRGVDLRGTPGEPVLAAGDGTVVYAGPLADRGVVSIDHGGGLRTSYEPVTPSVSPGRRVRRGEVIGHLDAGHPGCAAPACLHWGLRRDRTYLDPVVLVGPRHVRLLPW